MKRLLITALSLSASAFVITAQEHVPVAPGPQHRGGGPPPTPRPHLLGEVDANADSIWTQDELASLPEHLAKFDADQDGQLTLSELCPGRSGPRRARPTTAQARLESEEPTSAEPRPASLPPCLAVLDTDQDGVLSPDEIEAAPAAILRLDKDEDGQLTLAELCPGRQFRHRRGAADQPDAANAGPEHRQQPRGPAGSRRHQPADAPAHSAE